MRGPCRVGGFGEKLLSETGFLVSVGYDRRDGDLAGTFGLGSVVECSVARF